MTYPSCIELVNLEASCASIKKVGGAASYVYFVDRSFLYDNFKASSLPSLEYGTIGSGEGWKMIYDSSTETGLSIAKFEGIQLKNTGGFETVVADNVNSFTHSLTVILFHKSAEELELIQKLLLVEDLIAFVPTNAGDIKIFGIERGQPYSPEGTGTFTDKHGLKADTGTGADIVELQGDVGVSITLKALNMLSVPQILGACHDNETAVTVTSFTGMVAVLDLLSVNNV